MLTESYTRLFPRLSFSFSLTLCEPPPSLSSFTTLDFSATPLIVYRFPPPTPPIQYIKRSLNLISIESLSSLSISLLLTIFSLFSSHCSILLLYWSSPFTTISSLQHWFCFFVVDHQHHLTSTLLLLLLCSSVVQWFAASPWTNILIAQEFIICDGSFSQSY